MNPKKRGARPRALAYLANGAEANLELAAIERGVSVAGMKTARALGLYADRAFADGIVTPKEAATIMGGIRASLGLHREQYALDARDEEIATQITDRVCELDEERRKPQKARAALASGSYTPAA